MIHVIAAMTFTSLTHLICFAAMTERKYSVRKSTLIYAVFYIVFICLTAMDYLIFGSQSVYSIPVAFVLTIVLCFFVFLFTSADLFCKKLFLFVSYINIYCMIQCIALILYDVCFHGLSEAGGTYVKNIIKTLLYIPTVFVYLGRLRPVVRSVSGTKKRTWYSLSLVSVLFMIVFALFVTHFYNYYNHIYRDAGENLFLFCVVVLLYFAVLGVIFTTIRYMIEENKMELIQKNTEYLQGQLAVAKENERFAKTIRHDFRHHNQAIAAMLKNGETAEAIHYIEQYNESLDAARNQEFCPHITVNAILNSFYSKAQNSGIPVSISADTQTETAIADMDFVAILSNLLENAVNGCKECGKNGEITVNIRAVADKIVIVVSNPCLPELEIENNRIKQEGIGISSIVTALRKYDGDISYRLENGTLTVCIILKT